jgi:hypothetical protein
MPSPKDIVTRISLQHLNFRPPNTTKLHIYPLMRRYPFPPNLRRMSSPPYKTSIPDTIRGLQDLAERKDIERLLWDLGRWSRLPEDQNDTPYGCHWCVAWSDAQERRWQGNTMRFRCYGAEDNVARASLLVRVLEAADGVVAAGD